MPHFSESELFQACRVLFGSELNLNRDFLNYLQPSGVRTAFRKKAKATHPDRFAGSGQQFKNRYEKQFQHLNQAHQLIQSYLKQRNPQPAPIQPPRPTTPRTPRANPHKENPQRLYRGPIPERPLQFGQYLYYRGLSPYAAVISAITWQRQQRPTVGEIARRWQWLTLKEINRILETKNGTSRFGEHAEHLGLLKPLQVRTLLFHQRSRQQQIGRYFIDRNLIPETALDGLLSDLAAHNRNHVGRRSNLFYTQP